MASISTHGTTFRRRDLLGIAAGTGVAAAAGMGLSSTARAAETTLAIWTGFPELAPYYQAVADAYAAKHPDVKITIFSTSLREAEQKLSAAVPTGTGPDIYDIGTNITVNFIEAGLIQPNSPEIDAHLKSGAWSKLAVGFFTTDGKTYGLPFMEGSRASMYYNKTMLKEAGIAEPPATFPELIEAAKKLTKIDASGKMTRSGLSLRLSGQGSGVAEKFRYVLEAAGGAPIVQTKSGMWHTDFDNDAGRDALEFYVNAVQKDKFDDPRIQHDADAFVAETTAMLFREAWVIGEIQGKNPKLDYGVVPIPAWDKDKPHKMLLQPWGVYVNGKSSNQDAAWDFMKFLTSPENSLKLTEMTGWVGARADVDWAPLLAKTPQFQVFVDPPKGIEFYVEPVLAPWDEIQTKMADRLVQAFVDPSLLNNRENIAAVVHEMAVQADSLLKENDLYGTD
jgi:multiple sugar transport system substrate-binding protein